MESEHDGAPPSGRLLRLHKYFWRLASPSEADDIAARYAAESRVIEPLARQLLAAA